MLQLILGSAGTGKTAMITDLAATLAKTHPQPIMLLVPEQASFAYEKRMLRILGARQADRVEVLSFSRLAETVLGAPSKPPISEGGRTVLMSVALESMADRLNVYARYADSLSVTNELLKLSAEFKRCMLSPAALQVLAAGMPDCFLKQKLAEIGLILDAYDSLVAQRYTDDTDSLTRLEAYLADTPYFAGRVVCLDPFSGFTVQEYSVLERIMTQAEAVYVTLCADSPYAPRAYDPSAFAYVRRTAEKLMRAARRHDVPVRAPVVLTKQRRFRAEPLCHLERVFAGAQFAPYADDAPQITLVNASTLQQECACIAAEVKRLLRQEQYRAREIAVLFRSPETYEAPMRAALARCGVPIFEDKRQPVLTQPLIALVRGLCAVASRGPETESIMQILKTDLLGFTQEEVSALDNYALLWDLRPSDWKKPFTANPEGLEGEQTTETDEQLEKLNALRVRVVQPLLCFADAMREATGKQAAEEIYRFLERMETSAHLRELAVRLEADGAHEQAIQQQRVWDMLMETLDMFAVTLSDRPARAKRFAALMDMVLRAQTLGTIPHGLDEVTVGSIDRTIPDQPRAVFVPGVHEGEFPRLPSSGGLLTDAERMQLRSMDVELYDFGEVKIEEERFLVYKTLTSASERLYLTSAAAAADGSAAASSEVFRAIAETFPRCTRVQAPSMPLMDCIESDETAFEQMCLHSGDESEDYASLRAYFAADPAYASRLSALDRVVDRQPFAIADPMIARSLFGKHMNVSASRVESFYKCPFAYFCNYGLKAKPRKKAEFAVNLQGTLVHYVLEVILRQYGKDGLLAMDAASRASLVREQLDQYLEENLRDAQRTERFLYLYRRFGKTIAEILERLVMEFSVCAFEPVDFELKIDRDGDIPPYVTQLEDGGSVRIRGSVDRVDKLETDGKTYIRVIDYKSGTKEFKLFEALQGLNLQMLLYLFAIWQNGGARYAPPIVPAGILYMPAKAKFETAEHNVTADDAAQKKAKSMRMNGLLVDNPMILVSMDENKTGVFIPWPEKSRSESSLISLRQLSSLEKRTQRLLRDMASQLQSGHIPAYPSRSDGKEMCTYCDYRSVCGVEETDARREIDKANHAHSLELLEEVSEDAMD